LGGPKVENIGVSLAELKAHALKLAEVEQAELLRFLAARLRRDDPEYRQELADRIDDRNPANWVKWSELREQLDAGE
jgi:hypothetical protein